MSRQNQVSHIPDGLRVSDRVEFLKKVDRFGQLGATGLHAVIDFDRTLTIKVPGAEDDVTTWHILNDHMPVEARAEYESLFRKYRALELSGNMNTQHAITWWSSILNLFVDNNINLNEVESDFLKRASIRPGTRDLFELFTAKGIPSTVLSAGIHDVIDIWNRHYDVHPTLVLSTKLITNDEGAVIGWNKDSLVHVLNKHETDHLELKATRDSRPNTIVVGDSMNDASMAAGEENVIRVRILDRRADDPDMETETTQSFERFDAVITVGTLDPVRQLIEQIVE